ncbi:MAG: ATP synthase subunit I [Clostridia bacterium]|nr:ATP synthase subunit I [Clostridia bacterium]
MIDKTVLKETCYVAVGTVLLSVVMQGIWLLTGKWDISVLWGNLLSAGAGILNFFLMAYTVQVAVLKTEKGARNTVRLSQSLRLLFLLGIAVLGGVLECFNLYAVLIALFFPRIAITVRSIVLKKEAKPSAIESEETAPESETVIESEPVDPKPEANNER